MPLVNNLPIDEVDTCFFVYGTLRPGQARWKLLEPYAVNIEEATMRGLSLFTTEQFPFISDAGVGMGLKHVIGEIITIELPVLQLVLATLDVYEGYDPDDAANSLFIRKRLIARKQPDQKPVRCWAYAGGNHLSKGALDGVYPMIRSGDWKNQWK